MEQYFQNRLTESTAKQYSNIIKKISSDFIDNDDYNFFISEFQDVSDYLDTFSIPTRQKYSTVIVKFLPFLRNKKEHEFIEKYLQINRLCRTPNPRPRPPKGPTRELVPPPKVRMEVDQALPKQTKRSSKKKKHGLDESTLEKIDVLSKTFVDKKGQPLDPETTLKLYKSNLFTLCKRYNPETPNLDFLVNDVDAVLNILNNVSVYTGKGYYNSIVRYLPLAKPEELREEAYQRYLAWLKPKATPAAKYREEDYMGYNWTTFTKKVEQIIKTDKNDVHKLLLSLYTLIPPRRSADYSFMLIQGVDDKKNNVLVFNKNEKKFIFNYYKNKSKTGQQIIPITNKLLISRITTYLKNHKGNTYLFENDQREPLSKGDITKLLRDTIGKTYSIPSGIRRMRHMFCTHIVVDKPVDPRSLKHIAIQLGTSENVMINNYSDFKNKVLEGEVEKEDDS